MRGGIICEVFGFDAGVETVSVFKTGVVMLTDGRLRAAGSMSGIFASGHKG